MIQRLAGAGDADVEVAPPIDLSVVAVTPAAPPGRRRGDDRARTNATSTSRSTSPRELDAAGDPRSASHTDRRGRRNTSRFRAPRRRPSPATNSSPCRSLPLDVSSAVAADRADAYTRLVARRRGRPHRGRAHHARRGATSGSPPTNSSAGGAQHLRDLGTRFVVIGAELYADTISDDPPPTDRFVEAELPDGGTLPFLVVDPLAEQLTEAAADSILAGSTAIEWGVETLAEMLVEQADEDAVGASTAATTDRSTTTKPRPHHARPAESRSPPAPGTCAADHHDPVGALHAGICAHRRHRRRARRRRTGHDPAARDRRAIARGSRRAARRHRAELASAASMLPPDDPRPAAWSNELDSLISTGYSDAEVEAATAALRRRGRRD